MKKVFLVSGYGFTSNNFLQHVFFDSFCRQHGIKFINLSLQKYYTDYPNLNEHNRNPVVDDLIRIFIRAAEKLKLVHVVDFDDPEMAESYYQTVLKSEKLYCRGWHFRDFELVEKYRSVYQGLFFPDVDREDLDKRYLTRSHKEQIIVGLHVRRGDYKEFMDGQFYFEDDVYITKSKRALCGFRQRLQSYCFYK